MDRYLGNAHNLDQKMETALFEGGGEVCISFIRNNPITFIKCLRIKFNACVSMYSSRLQKKNRVRSAIQILKMRLHACGL